MAYRRRFIFKNCQWRPTTRINFTYNVRDVFGHRHLAIYVPANCCVYDFPRIWSSASIVAQFGQTCIYNQLWQLILLRTNFVHSIIQKNLLNFENVNVHDLWIFVYNSLVYKSRKIAYCKLNTICTLTTNRRISTGKVSTDSRIYRVAPKSKPLSNGQKSY